MPLGRATVSSGRVAFAAVGTARPSAGAAHRNRQPWRLLACCDAASGTFAEAWAEPSGVIPWGKLAPSSPFWL